MPSYFPWRARRTAALLLLCAVLPPACAGAQGTAVVQLSDPAYRDVDRLAALGMLDSTIIGQRPYSRREMTRIVRLAAARQATGSAVARHGLAPLRRLESRFGERALPRGPSLAFALDGAGLAANSTDAPRRGFSGSITRALEASIQPLVERRLGVPVAPGQGTALELSHELSPTRWLSFNAAERLEGHARQVPVPSWDAELLLGGGRLRYRNIAVQVGREQLAWAQHRGDGLFLASDAPALDLVSISGDAPFRMPGLLRVFGPTQATLVVADLGRSVARSESKLLAYKISVQPRRSVELGATFMNHYGGRGGRASGLGTRIIDFLPFVDIFRGHNYTDTTRALDVDSDKLLGIDGRWRVAALGGVVLTTELLIDDFDVHRIPTLFTWDGAQTVGAELVSIAGSAVSARVSAKHTGVRTYAHGSLSNGIATRGRLLGDELGPDAKSFGVEAGWHPDDGLRGTLEVVSAIMSRADYVTDERGSYFDIRRLGPATNELRDRVVASAISELRPNWVLTWRLGVERVRNADFAGGVRRDYAADVALRFFR